MLNNVVHLRTPFLFYPMVLIPLVAIAVRQVLATGFVTRDFIICFVLASLPGAYFFPTVLHYSL